MSRTAEQHYADHREKPFFGGLVDFITSRRWSRWLWRAPSHRLSGSRRPPALSTRRRARSVATSRIETARTLSTRPIRRGAQPGARALVPADELLAYERDIDRWALAPVD